MEKFFFHVGLWLILLALAAKTFRTKTIANNVGFKRVKITDKQLLQKIAVVMVIVVAALIIDTTIDDFEITFLMSDPVIDETGMKTVHRIKKNCNLGGKITSYHFGIILSEVMALIYLCIQVSLLVCLCLLCFFCGKFLSQTNLPSSLLNHSHTRARLTTHGGSPARSQSQNTLLWRYTLIIYRINMVI